jgi:hypothetical protein
MQSCVQKEVDTRPESSTFQTPGLPLRRDGSNNSINCSRFQFPADADDAQNGGVYAFRSQPIRQDAYFNNACLELGQAADARG